MSTHAWTKTPQKKPESEVYTSQGRAMQAASGTTGKIIKKARGGYILVDQPNPTRPTPPKGGLWDAFLRSGEKK